jgi:ribosomal protein L9
MAVRTHDRPSPGRRVLALENPRAHEDRLGTQLAAQRSIRRGGDSARSEIEHQQRVIGDRRAKELKDLEALKIRMEAVVLEFEAQVGEEGKLFGSVTAQQLADQLAEKGQVVDRRKISLEEPIRSVGEHTVSIRLQGDVTADVKVIVKAID